MGVASQILHLASNRVLQYTSEVAGFHTGFFPWGEMYSRCVQKGVCAHVSLPMSVCPLEILDIFKDKKCQIQL